LKYEIGEKFGLLTVIDNEDRYVTTGGYSYLRYKCKCDCGNEVMARKSNLKGSKVISCGCVQRGTDGILHKRHNMYGTPIYQTWFAMKSRCSNTRDAFVCSVYKDRNITVCEKWLSFSGFFEEMGDSHIEGYSIDRIDNDKGYFKDNCRWADKTTQAYNQRKQVTNTSGKTGVHWDKKSNKWRVKFTIPRTTKIVVAWFRYLWDAVIYRMQLEQEHYGYVKE